MLDSISSDAQEGKPQTTFIYALIDPETNEVRYVGKTNNPTYRLLRHLGQNTDCYRTRWVNDLKRRGLKPTLQVIEEVPIAQWEARECYWIAYYRSQGCPLTNTAPGGVGLTGGTKPAPHSEESRRRQSEKTRGMKRSPETCARISAVKTGAKRAPMSEEGRRNVGNAQRGKKHSPESIEKTASAQRGKKRGPLSPEHRAKVSESLRGRKMPPEGVAKSADTRRGQKRSPEARAQMSASHRGKKQSPEQIAARAAATQRTKTMKKASPPDAPTLWD